ncbi:MAG: choice-of-anchor D domain-containing protein [Ilumatobacteraceae bacterium]
MTIALVALGPGVSEGAPVLTPLDTSATLAASLRSPAVSDDGTTVAYVSDASGAPTVVVQRNGALVARVAAAGATELAPAISGDGCQVAFWVSTDPIGPATAPSSPVTTAPAGTVTLTRWNVCSGAAPESLSMPGGLTAASTVVRPALSRDGAAIAYAVRTGASSPWRVGVLVDGADHPVRSDAAPLSVVTTVDLSADGSTLAYDYGTGSTVAPTAVSVGPLDAAPSAIPGGASTVMAMPSLSADGSLVAFVAGASEAALRPYVFSTLTGTSVNIDAVSAGQILQPVITPDGSQVAYTVVASPSGLSPSGATSIVVGRSTSGMFDTTAQETLTASPVPAGSTSSAPAISATGQVALFATVDGQGSDIWLAARAPVLTVTPAFNLGTVAVGSSSQPAAVTFTNPSSVSVTLAAVTGVTAPFSVSADTCSNSTVPPAGTCTVTVVFSPTEADSSTAAVTVTGDGLSEPVSASLSGTGRALARSISISPTTLQFPSTALGARGGPVGATVTNTGEVAVDISGISIGGTDGGQFVLTGNGCASVSLAPGATCAIEVTAIPSRSGSLRGTVTATGAQDESASATLAVTATSATTTTRASATTQPTTTTAPGRLSASPFAVTFPATPIGSTSPTVPVTITNVGSSTVSKLTVEVVGDEQYAVDGGSCAGADLAAGRSCTVEVAITPQEGGSPTATLTVAGSRDETVSVSLSASTDASATVRVNPGVARAGGTTTVIGSGFTAGTAVDVQLLAPNGAGTPVPLASVLAGPDGGFRLLIQVPGNVGQGGWRVQAVVDGQTTGSVALLVEPGTPQPGSPAGGGVVAVVRDGVRG